MKSIVSFAHNFLFVPKVGEGTTITPAVELVVTISEPGYKFDLDNQLTKQPVAETVRFVAGPDSLRAMAKHLNEAADEAEKMLAEIRETVADEEKA